MSSDGGFAFLLPFIFITFGCLFLLVSHWGSQSARRWGIGYLLASGGFLTPWTFPTLPAELHALAADALFLGAAYCYSDALFLHFGKTRFTRLRAGFALAVYGVIAYAIQVRHSLGDELLFGDIGFACLMSFPLPFIWPKANQRIEKLLLVMASLAVADCVIRNVILVGILPASDGLESFATSIYAYAMQVTSSVLGMLLALTAIANVILQAMAAYREAAERDPLTKLLNRSGFERAVAAIGKTDFAVFVADIDHFKTVNDRYGHAKGDQALIAFADIFRRFLPASSVVSRFGGEEFVVCLPGVRAADAGYLANTVRLALEYHDWPSLGIDRRITASFGIGNPAAADHSIHETIARADKALYAAKDAGRNKVMADALPAAPTLLQVISAA
jgi:diguanylate cyclase (GGDEF)-like protein